MRITMIVLAILLGAAVGRAEEVNRWSKGDKHSLGCSRGETKMPAVATMTNQRQEYEHRARECVQGLHGLMAEAKKEGYAIEVFSSLDMSGEPKSRVAVLAR